MRRAAILVVLAFVALQPVPSASADAPRVVAVETLGTTRPPATAPRSQSGPPKEIAPLHRGPASDATQDGPTFAAPSQTAVVRASAPSVGINIRGFRMGVVLPPDPAGEVGPTQFVHTANTLRGSIVGVFDKTTGDGVKRFLMDSLATRGVCRHGLGDGVPFYDQIDAVWFLTEIASRGNSLCIYVSSGSDASTSTYQGYRIAFNLFPDYPKWAVWSNAIYLGFNNSGFSDPIVALNRTKMAAQMTLSPTDVVFDNVHAERGFNFQLLVPVDSDGATPPPPTAPGIFIRHVDDEVNRRPGMRDPAHDFIEYFEMTPDFVGGTETTAGPFDVPVSEFDSRLCPGTALQCIPQRGTRVRLDSLREPMMNRPVMRVIGANQTMVGSFTVDAGHNRAGVRWFELTRPAATTSGAWTLADEGTFAPSGAQRWVPSVDIDDAGDIALGYSVSSGRIFPRIEITGRHAGDPAGVMTQDEVVIAKSAGPQTFAPRWGDYTEMSVDPAPGATTFWYTNEYLDRFGEWRTRIASFTLGP